MSSSNIYVLIFYDADIEKGIKNALRGLQSTGEQNMSLCLTGHISLLIDFLTGDG